VAAGHDDPDRRERNLIWWRGQYLPIAGHGLVCINPLFWRLDDDAPASANLGALGGAGSDGPLPPLIPAVTGARCGDGLLEVAPRPNVSRKFSNVLTWFGSYHVYDYNLFYLNLRQNVAVRIASFNGVARPKQNSHS
jgi:hypothetical protein